MSDKRAKAEEHQRLAKIIEQWNSSRLDLFEISQPSQDLEFHGVMRFFFQEVGSKVATKCIRVSSKDQCADIKETLIEKFRPDMRMLSVGSNYSLYEVHPNGEERKLADHEHPLVVQLNWNYDDREGRFLLKNNYEPDEGSNDANSGKRNKTKNKKSKGKDKTKAMNHKAKSSPALQNAQQGPPGNGHIKVPQQNGVHGNGRVAGHNDKNGVAKELYREVPETSFTRSISNPEAVMRRRRQQKIESKLDGGVDGRPPRTGTLKIYANTLFPEVPYKTLLFNMSHTTEDVLLETLEKYGLEKEDPLEYCIVLVILSPDLLGTSDSDTSGGESLGGKKQRILDDHECPLAVASRYPEESIMFQLRQRRDVKHLVKEDDSNYESDNAGQDDDSDDDDLPYLLEIPPHGTDVNYKPRIIILRSTTTEFGSGQRPPNCSGDYNRILGPDVATRHCIMASIEGYITVTPASEGAAETYIDGQQIYSTTSLQHGNRLRIGSLLTFKYCDPLCGKIKELEELDRQKKRSILPFEYELDDQQDYELPATIAYLESAEDTFFSSIISKVNEINVGFKLSPSYILYISARYLINPQYKPDLSIQQREQLIGSKLKKVAGMIWNTVKENPNNGSLMALWMANASELLHFLKMDVHLCNATYDVQTVLKQAVDSTFRCLTQCVEQELNYVMPAFLDESQDVDITNDDLRYLLSIESHDEQVYVSAKSATRWMDPKVVTNLQQGYKPTMSDILRTLSAAIRLLRNCGVNAALTVQLFSHIFHYVNRLLFNKLVLEPKSRLCKKIWAKRIINRLGYIESWAHKEGLELAAESHLARIYQALFFLKSPKGIVDLEATVSRCALLNSKQLRVIMDNYQQCNESREDKISRQAADKMIALATNTVDARLLAEGFEVKVEEDGNLQIPFILPEDGYTCEMIKGIPPGLEDFLSEFSKSDICRLTSQSRASGSWTVWLRGFVDIEYTERFYKLDNVSPGYLPESDSEDAEIEYITFYKGGASLGLSIVAARGTNQQECGIYIKSVVKGGIADKDGRLQAGDQILTVDGRSLIGISQEQAAEVMQRTGNEVALEIAKKAALYHGLGTLLLSNGSPTSPDSLSPDILPTTITDQRDPRSVNQGSAPRLYDFDMDKNDDDLRFEELPRGSRVNLNGYSQSRDNEPKQKRSVRFKDQLEEHAIFGEDKPKRPNDMEEYSFDDLEEEKHQPNRQYHANSKGTKRVQFKVDEDVSDGGEEEPNPPRYWSNTASKSSHGQPPQSYPVPARNNNISPEASPLPPPMPPQPILSPDSLSPPPPLPQSVIKSSNFPPPSVSDRVSNQNPAGDPKIHQNVPPRHASATRGPHPINSAGNPIANPNGRKPKPNLSLPVSQPIGIPVVNGRRSPQSPPSPTVSQRSSSLPNQRGMNFRPPASPTPSQRKQSLLHGGNRPRPASPTGSQSSKPTMPVGAIARGQPSHFQFPPNPGNVHNPYVGQPPSPSPTSSSSSQQTIRSQSSLINHQKPPSPVTQMPPGPPIAPKPAIRVPLPIANSQKPSNVAIRGPPAPPPRGNGNIRPTNINTNVTYNHDPPIVNGNNNNLGSNINGNNLRIKSQPQQPVPPTRRSSNMPSQPIAANAPYRTVSTPSINKLPQHNHVGPEQYNQPRINLPPTRGVSQQDLSTVGNNAQRGNFVRNGANDNIPSTRGMNPSNRTQSLMAINSNGALPRPQKFSTSSISEEADPSDMTFAARRAMFS